MFNFLVQLGLAGIGVITLIFIGVIVLGLLAIMIGFFAGDSSSKEPVKTAAEIRKEEELEEKQKQQDTYHLKLWIVLAASFVLSIGVMYLIAFTQQKLGYR